MVVPTLGKIARRGEDGLLQDFIRRVDYVYLASTRTATYRTTPAHSRTAIVVIPASSIFILSMVKPHSMHQARISSGICR